MTIIVANTANTSTFDYWRNRTNELADAMTNKTVTVDSNTATGNAAITGTFTCNSMNILQSQGSVETSGTTNTEINNYLTNTYASAEYLFAVKDNNANNYYASKVLVTHDVDNAYLSEYAIIVSNTYIGSFFANSNTSHVRVNFNPTSTNTTINFTRIEA
jgi:hypothetical protein